MAGRLIGFLCFSFLLLSSEVLGASFTFANNCEYTVWPGLLSSAGSSPLSTTGFSLNKGESRSVVAPSGWSGRFWSRTLCSTDSTGKFSCLTGDCGSGTVECSGSGAAPPATLAEFTLDGSGAMDFYDVSLVDGYNLPMLVVPLSGGSNSSNCISTGCVVDLNGACPAELKVMENSGEGVACKSACEAFGKPEFCCSGEFGNPNTCKPSAYSEFFKKACPRAYSYAYDDGTSTFTCPGGTSYLITFCPTTSSQKSSEENPQAAMPGGGHTTMVYNGASPCGGAAGKWAAALTVFLAVASLL